MKSLALSLILLFLAGTQSHYIGRRDTSESKPSTIGVKEKLKTIYKDLYTLIVELSTMAESPYKDILDTVDNKIESLVYDSYYVAWSAYQFVKEAYDEEEKTFQETFPVYKSKVRPIIQEGNQKVSEYLSSLKSEVLTFINETYEKCNIQYSILKKKLLSLVERDEDKLKTLKEELIAGLKPFVDQVKEELGAAAAAEKKQEAVDQSHSEDIARYKDILKGLFSPDYKDFVKMIEILEEESKKA